MRRTVLDLLAQNAGVSRDCWQYVNGAVYWPDDARRADSFEYPEEYPELTDEDAWALPR